MSEFCKWLFVAVVGSPAKTMTTAAMMMIPLLLLLLLLLTRRIAGPKLRFSAFSSPRAHKVPIIIASYDTVFRFTTSNIALHCCSYYRQRMDEDDSLVLGSPKNLTPEPNFLTE